jgi:hypothetical protein
MDTAVLSKSLALFEIELYKGLRDYTHVLAPLICCDSDKDEKSPCYTAFFAGSLKRLVAVGLLTDLCCNRC